MTKSNKSKTLELLLWCPACKKEHYINIEPDKETDDRFEPRQKIFCPTRKGWVIGVVKPRA